MTVYDHEKEKKKKYVGGTFIREWDKPRNQRPDHYNAWCDFSEKVSANPIEPYGDVYRRLRKKHHKE